MNYFKVIVSLQIEIKEFKSNIKYNETKKKILIEAYFKEIIIECEDRHSSSSAKSKQYIFKKINFIFMYNLIKLNTNCFSGMLNCSKVINLEQFHILLKNCAL